MNADFPYDVFLSHSSKDKAVVRPLAERLKKDGLKVWFDEWALKSGDSIPAKIEEGLEHSRVLVLCMSAHAFGSDWAQLEAGTFRFRDPLNKERRFIPLRLDDAPIKGSLAQFLYINWLPANREQEYPKLLETCPPSRDRRGLRIVSTPASPPGNSSRQADPNLHERRETSSRLRCRRLDETLLQTAARRIRPASFPAWDPCRGGSMQCQSPALYQETQTTTTAKLLFLSIISQHAINQSAKQRNTVYE